VPDLVDRDFTATGPDQLWVADITYISTWAGFLFLAIMLDVWSRRIVGWAMATHLRTELVLDALDMAFARRRPQGVIHHWDQGCAVYVSGLWTPVRSDGCPAFQGFSGERLRQCHGGVVFRTAWV
jgi:putative transposase